MENHTKANSEREQHVCVSVREQRTPYNPICVLFVRVARLIRVHSVGWGPRTPTHTVHPEIRSEQLPMRHCRKLRQVGECLSSVS